MVISKASGIIKWLYFPVSQKLEGEDPNKTEEKQASEAGEGDEKRDKTKEEIEKEHTDAKEDVKKTSAKSKDLEPVSSKTKGPMVGVYLDLHLIAPYYY